MHNVTVGILFFSSFLTSLSVVPSKQGLLGQFLETDHSAQSVIKLIKSKIRDRSTLIDTELSL